MVLRSGRDVSTRPQVKAVDQLAPSKKLSIESSGLTSGLDSGDAGIQACLAALNPDIQPRPATLNPGGVSNSSGGEFLLSSGSLGSRRSRGTLASRHGRDQSPIPRSPAIRNSGHGSSFPGDSIDNDTERPRSSVRSGTFFSRITSRRSGHSSSQLAERLRNENPGESLREIRKQLAGLEKEKELVSLTRKLKEIEAEKAAGFSDSQGQSSVFLESAEEAFVGRQIVRESKLTVPLVRAYSDVNNAAYQDFIRACEHVFRTRPVTYQKDMDKMLYGIEALEGIASTTWFCYKEKLGRVDISWDAFKPFLLDDLFAPEIRLRDVHKKYREVM